MYRTERNMYLSFLCLSRQFQIGDTQGGVYLHDSECTGESINPNSLAYMRPVHPSIIAQFSESRDRLLWT